MLGLCQGSPLSLPPPPPARIPIEWGHQPFASNYQKRKLRRRCPGLPAALRGERHALPRQRPASDQPGFLAGTRALEPTIVRAAGSSEPAGVLGPASTSDAHAGLRAPGSAGTPGRWPCQAAAPRAQGLRSLGPVAQLQWAHMALLDLPLRTQQRAIRLPEVPGGGGAARRS